QSYRARIDIYLEALAVAHVIVVRVNFCRASSYGKDSIGHLELQYLTPFEAFVLYRWIDVIILGRKTGKQTKQDQAQYHSFSHVKSHPGRRGLPTNLKLFVINTV